MVKFRSQGTNVLPAVQTPQLKPRDVKKKQFLQLRKEEQKISNASLAAKVGGHCTCLQMRMMAIGKPRGDAFSVPASRGPEAHLDAHGGAGPDEVCHAG